MGLVALGLLIVLGLLWLLPTTALDTDSSQAASKHGEVHGTQGIASVGRAGASREADSGSSEKAVVSSGRVLNADGSPSVGAEVFMIHGSGSQVARRVQDNLDDVPKPAAITDRDGKFELTHAETAVALLARAPDGRFVFDRE